MFLVWVLGCGDPQPPEPVKSAPAGPEQEGGLVAQTKSDRRPDGREPLRVSELKSVDVAGFSELDAEQQGIALAFFNGSTGACEVCLDEGMSLGDCLNVAPSGCENIPALAARVVRLAGEGVSLEELSEQVERPDAWVAGTPSADAPVTLVGVIDEGTLSTQARESWEQVVTRCAPHVALVQVSDADPGWGVRSAPTQFVNGYRLRGLRDAEVMVGIVNAELGDHGLSCPD